MRRRAGPCAARGGARRAPHPPPTHTFSPLEQMLHEQLVAGRAKRASRAAALRHPTPTHHNHIPSVPRRTGLDEAFQPARAAACHSQGADCAAALLRSASRRWLPGQCRAAGAAPPRLAPFTGRLSSNCQLRLAVRLVASSAPARRAPAALARVGRRATGAGVRRGWRHAVAQAVCVKGKGRRLTAPPRSLPPRCQAVWQAYIFARARALMSAPHSAGCCGAVA